MLQERARTVWGGSAGGGDHSSEELLEAQVQADLHESCCHEIRRVKYQLHSGVLTLQGQVPSHYHKRVAQVLARSRLGGAAMVRNKLQVATATRRG